MANKKIVLDFKRAVPIYKQLIEEFTNRIVSRELKAGDQMPSIRQLTEEININPNTIAKAYREMVQEGLLENRRGLGCFVSQRPSRPSTLSIEEQQEHLERLFHSFICAAEALGIPRRVVVAFIAKKQTELTQSNIRRRYKICFIFQ